MNFPKNKKIIVTTHCLTYGPAQALRDFLYKEKMEEVFYISHPLNEYSKQVSFLELIEKGELKFRKQKKRKEKNFIYKCFLDFWFTFKQVWNLREQFDLFVGSDNLNALSGIILKFFRRVNKVVYYTIDYYPKRFENKFLNWLYYRIDKFCVRYSDEVWNLSSSMTEAREKKMKIKYKDKQKVVPIGVWFKRVERKQFLDIKVNELVFVGQLVKELGVDLVIRSIPKIIKKIPNFKFLLIGGGEEYDNLQKLARELGVEEYITFTGWVKDRIELENLMLDSAIGIAPFNIEILDERVYNADPAKIKDYMLMGMPVILTNAPVSAKKIEKEECGILIDYDEDSLADAVVGLMKNKDKLMKYRENVIDYIKKYDWDNIFEKNLSRIFK